MYGRNFSGGDNRTHGQIEQTPRIDSFDAMRQSYGGVLFAGGTVLDCDRFIEYGPDGIAQEIVELSYPGSRWTHKFRLARVNNGFGGTRAFWICPLCGRRFRYLYFESRRFICRSCAKLNYKSQQETKDSMVGYRKGMALVEKHLTLPPFLIDGFSFVHYLPEKPKGMHKSTYHRHLARFFKYQKKHSDRLLLDVSRIAGMFK